MVREGETKEGRGNEGREDEEGDRWRGNASSSFSPSLSASSISLCGETERAIFLPTAHATRASHLFSRNRKNARKGRFERGKVCAKIKISRVSLSLSPLFPLADSSFLHLCESEGPDRSPLFQESLNKILSYLQRTRKGKKKKRSFLQNPFLLRTRCMRRVLLDSMLLLTKEEMYHENLSPLLED